MLTSPLEFVAAAEAENAEWPVPGNRGLPSPKPNPRCDVGMCKYDGVDMAERNENSKMKLSELFFKVGQCNRVTS